MDKKFKSSLHKNIFEKSGECVFKLTSVEVSILKASVKKLITIAGQKFRLVEESGEYFLFATTSLTEEYKIEGDLFIVGDVSKKIITWKKEVTPTVENIDLSEFNREIKKKQTDISIPSVSQYSDFGNDSELDTTSITLQAPMDFSITSGVWFTLNKDFRDTDEFWSDLKQYYNFHPERVRVLSGEKEVLPIFSKRTSDLNLSLLQEAVLEKISERVDSLEENKESIRKQLVELESELVNKGIIPSEDSKFEELVEEQKSLSECIQRANDSLENYSKHLLEIKSESGNVPEKFFLDIKGNPQTLSKYHDQVISKLIDLNIEINEIYKLHYELEHVLIKRLKDIDHVKDIKSRLRELSREQVLKDFSEGNLEALEREERKSSLAKLGELNESVAFIRKKISQEKEKIDYYLSNLKDIRDYESYEAALFEHHKKKKQLSRDAFKFRKKIYQLSLSMDRRERKYRDFFANTKSSILDFKKEVVDTYKRHDDLACDCFRTWLGKWDEEAVPNIKSIYGRSDEIVEAFSLIPPTQIVKVYQLQKKLKQEALSRQKEWEKIYSLVKKEFKDMGYERELKGASEVDPVYLDKLDSSEVHLSQDTKDTLFLQKSTFSLALQKDPVIGLDPKVLDDDQFLVIDQVWSTLTPDQAKEAERILTKEHHAQQQIELKAKKQQLQTEQLENIKNRFSVKLSSIEKLSKKFTPAQKSEKLSESEKEELKLWKEDNYLIANTKGEFKDTLYELTKKLFHTKSVHMIDDKIEVSDTGLLKDGKTEIFSAKDYFLKPEDNQFKDISDSIDLSAPENIHSEPDNDFIELLAQDDYLGHLKGLEEKTAPRAPSVLEWARISVKKYREEKDKVYELDILKERLLELDDEVKKIREYHEKAGEHLDSIISDKNEVFEQLKKDSDEMKAYLSDKESELDGIFSSTEADIGITLESINKELSQANETDIPKPKKKGFIYYLVKVWKGERVEEDV